MVCLCVFLLIFLSCLHSGAGLSRPSTMRLQNNEFKNVVIAIHDSVPEDKLLINTLKDVMTKASQYLYKATRQRAYFKEIKILLPSSWSSDPTYQTPTTETLSMADVIVTDPIRGKRSVPVTRSYDGCGKQGIHVLLTKEFLTLPRVEPYFNDPGKYFVHAFAQFRWGVFQEYAEEGESEFYLSAYSGRPEAIRCTFMIRGLVQKNDSTHTICYLPSQAQSAHVIASYDPNTGLYDAACQWRPYPNRQRTKASIMDHQYIAELETFCDDDHANYMTEHNYEAPSKHNRLCAHRSTWDVITNTDDFQGSSNPPGGLLDSQLTPDFIVMRSSSRKRRALIMVDPDILASPTDNRQVFRTLAHLKHEAVMHNIDISVSDSMQEQPVNAIEKVPSLSHQSLQDNIKNVTSDPDPSTIYLLLKTGGSLNCSVGSPIDRASAPSSTDHRNVIDVSEKKEVDVIHTYGTSDGNYILDQIRSLFIGENPDTIIVIQEVFLLSDKEAFSHLVEIDQTLSRHTMFIFHYQTLLPDIELRSPSGVIYGIEGDACVTDFEFRIVTCYFAFIETGSWKFTIRSTDSSAQKIEVTVLSEHGNMKVDPVVIRHSERVVEETGHALLLHVDATQGNHPVIGLNVMARVETEGGQVQNLKLLDNGAGVDISKDDGVYSRAFLTNGLAGPFHVNYVVYGKEGETFKKEAELAISDDELNPIKTKTSRIPLIGNLQRHIPGDTLVISRHKRSNLDPAEVLPSRITDLQATKYMLYRNTVVLTWTAPGEDYDHGRVNRYEIIIGYDVKSVKQFLQYVVSGGYKGEGQIKLELFPATKDGSLTQVLLWQPKVEAKTLMFAVRGIDKRGNKGEISNIATTLTDY